MTGIINAMANISPQRLESFAVILVSIVACFATYTSAVQAYTLTQAGVATNKVAIEKIQNGDMEERKELRKTLDEVSKAVYALNTEVAVLNARLEAMEKN